MKADAVASTKPIGERRQRYGKEFRDRMVALTLEPGASVSAVALAHQLNTNMLFNWRRRHLREFAVAKLHGAKLLPVKVAGEATPKVSSKHKSKANRQEAECRPGNGWIEIELPKGRIRLHGSVPIQTLRSVLGILSER